MMIYETRKEAEQNMSGDLAIVQVDGGFLITEWRDAFRRYEEEAEALKAGGWTSTDKEELMQVYGFDDEHAENIIDALKELEEKEEA